MEDIYYWLSILLVVTGTGYFVAQGVGADSTTPSPTPVEGSSRLEALRQVIDNDDKIKEDEEAEAIEGVPPEEIAVP